MLTAFNVMGSTSRSSKFDGKYVRFSFGHVEFEEISSKQEAIWVRDSEHKSELEIKRK